MDTAAGSPELLAYPLVARGLAPDSTVIEVRGRRIGDGFFGLVAGPCTVETREQTLETARAVAAAGATVLRGGAFKPRSSPYAFQGLGAKGLEILSEARDETGLPIVTELLDPRDVASVAETHLPVVVDPSHAAGQSDLVLPLARAAVAAGVSGIFMETHPDPDKALSDGPNAWPLPRMRELLSLLIELDRSVKARPFAEAAL